MTAASNLELLFRGESFRQLQSQDRNIVADIAIVVRLRVDMSRIRTRHDRSRNLEASRISPLYEQRSIRVRLSACSILK